MYAEQLRERKNTDDVTTLFLIEEPEIYMHPEMCRRMRDALLRIAQSGIGQIICTTHSPVFLDLADRHDGIVMVKREGEFPAIIQRVDDVFDQTEGDRVQRARLRMTLNFDPMVNEVFFANRVCLVEGDCEIAAIDAIARKLDEQGQVHWPTYLAARRSIAVINCKGKSTIPAFQKVLNAFSIKYCVVHDEDEDPGPLRVNKTIEALLLSTSERLVHAPNFEKSIFNDSWKKDKPWRATVAIKSAATIDSRLIAFFEFILGKSIDQLRQSSLSKSAEEPFFAPVSRLPKRNLRSDLRRINVPEQAYQRADELGQVFRIAAGPSFMPATGETGRLHKIDGSPVSVFAVVAGDSMTDTLIPGDILALEVLDDVNIYPVTDERGKMTAGEIRKIIDDNAIYVLAKDDEYAHRSYTIKRIRVSELANGGWHGEICADNPETSWGDRGQVAIRKGDRVHFAAKVVGLVSRVAESPLESQTDSIPGDKP
jgi:signal peptidase I